MSSFFFLFFKRNIRLYIRICFLSFIMLSLPSIFVIGSASFERLSFQSALKTSQFDLEIQAPLTHDYSSDNFSLFSSIFNNWINISSSWNKYSVCDGLLFFMEDSSWNDPLFVGIDFSSIANNTRKSTIKDNITAIFNNSIAINNFSIQNYLPFNLDIIINKNMFNNLNLSSFLFSKIKIGYYIDFSSKFIVSFSKLDDILNEIIYNFRTFLMEENLGFGDAIKVKTLEDSALTSFEKPFTSITLLFSLITILSVIWLIVIYTRKFISEITPQMTLLEQRGLQKKQRIIIQIAFPVSADCSALLILFSLYLFLFFYLNLEVTFAFIITILVFIFLSYKRYKNTKKHSVTSKENIKVTLLRHVLFLILISVTFIVTIRTFPILIPLRLNSYINSGVIIIQYYILTLLISDLLISLIKRQFAKFKGLKALTTKVLFSKKSHLRSWLHSVILLGWALTIIISSIQTFNVNYKLDNNISNLTDIKLKVSLPLSNISYIQSLSEIQFALPISYSEEVYFEKYDFYLLDIQLLHKHHPELFEFIHSFKLNTSSTYVSIDLAETLDFQEGDLFPTKFGYNKTNIIVNQPIIITIVFPLIKQEENKPFVVAAYRKEFENFTEVNRLLVDFQDNISIQEGINILKKVLGTDFQLETKTQQFKYELPLNIFEYSFLIITLVSVGTSLFILSKEINPIFDKFIEHGMEKAKLKKIVVKQVGIMMLYSFSVSVVLGLIFVFFQMPKMIYQIPLFLPIQIKINSSIIITLLIPVVCLLIALFRLRFNIIK